MRNWSLTQLGVVVMAVSSDPQPVVQGRPGGPHHQNSPIKAQVPRRCHFLALNGTSNTHLTCNPKEVVVSLSATGPCAARGPAGTDARKHGKSPLLLIREIIHLLNSLPREHRRVSLISLCTECVSVRFRGHRRNLGRFFETAPSGCWRRSLSARKLPTGGSECAACYRRCVLGMMQKVSWFGRPRQ